MWKTVLTPQRMSTPRRTTLFCDLEGTTSLQYTVKLPTNLVINTLADNGIAAFCLTNGTVRESYQWERCGSGTPAAGRWSASNNYSLATSDGMAQNVRGRHLGSQMPGLGGLIRRGELTTAAGQYPHHTLAVDLPAAVLFYDPNDPDGTPGYRWPAIVADGCARNTDSCYDGIYPDLEMGALVTVRGTAADLGLETEAGKKIFRALKNYSAYVVDSGGANTWGIAAERDSTTLENVAEDDLQMAYSITLNGTNQASINFREDMVRIYRALRVVKNATESTPKGPN